jgi:3-hydroxyacyl-[acyl-carrier-protein] dehydratase
MRLQDDFFTLIRAESCEEKATYHVQLNAEHSIYAAHFPGNPITPGVCIIQMVKELAEEHRHKKFFLQKVANAKFLNVLNPLQHGEIQLDLSFAEEERQYKVAATIFHVDTVFSKLSLVLTER